MPRWLTAEREQWRGCAETFCKYTSAVFKAAFLSMFLCHALFLFYGYTSPDGTNEGLFYYWNQNWALSIGRWMMRYLSAAGCNVVMPAIFWRSTPPAPPPPCCCWPICGTLRASRC